MAKKYTIKFDGVDEAVVKVANAAKEGIARATLSVLRDSKISVNQSYPPASTPGEPPHKRTGNLLSRIDHEFDNDGLVGRVGSNLDYARFLELGTEKMEPRPYLRPAMDRAAGGIEKFFPKNGV